MHHTKRLSVTQAAILIVWLSGLSGCASSMVSAVLRRDTAKVQALLDKGMDVNAPVYLGGAPQFTSPALVLAAQAGPAEMVQLLIDKGADLEKGDYHGNTPLMMAAYYGRVEVVKILLAAGADPLARNERGETAAGAAKRGEQGAVQYNVPSRLVDLPKVVHLLEEAEQKARRRSGRQAEQTAVQAALEARLPAIQSAEQQGDDTRQAGRHEEALTYYTVALREAPPGTEPQQRLREKVIHYALSLGSPPPIPEEARHHANRGMAFVKKATSRDNYELAVSEFEQALLLAPWWGDAYFNLGLVQEKTEEYAAAIQNLRLYLLATPDDPNAGAVNKKIAELEVAQELAERR